MRARNRWTHFHRSSRTRSASGRPAARASGRNRRVRTSRWRSGHLLPRMAGVAPARGVAARRCLRSRRADHFARPPGSRLFPDAPRPHLERLAQAARRPGGRAGPGEISRPRRFGGRTLRPGGRVGTAGTHSRGLRRLQCPGSGRPEESAAFESRLPMAAANAACSTERPTLAIPGGAPPGADPSADVVAAVDVAHAPGDGSGDPG